MSLKFDNMPGVAEDARWITLSYGKFLCVFYDLKSPAFARTQMRLMRPYKNMPAESLPDDINRLISIQIFIELSLRDWSGIKADGKDVPFSKENATELFKQHKRVFYDVVEEAVALGNYQLTEENAKN